MAWDDDDFDVNMDDVVLAGGKLGNGEFAGVELGTYKGETVAVRIHALQWSWSCHGRWKLDITHLVFSTHCLQVKIQERKEEELEKYIVSELIISKRLNHPNLITLKGAR